MINCLQKTTWTMLTIAIILTGGASLASEASEVNTTLQLAQNGDTDAQYLLGNMYNKGQGTDKDAKQAAFWYVRAAMGDHTEAQYQLGLMYDTGVGVSQDYTQALIWYSKAAGKGHSEAQSHRERIHDHIDALRHAADTGEAEAQCTLGDMYSKGNGVPHDDEHAVSWYRQAAEQGSATGQFSLGFMHAEGRGTPQDYQEAVAWYRKAAAQGHADAEYHLSALFFKGLGVPQDAVSAFAWLSLAAAQGHELAATNKAFAASRLTPDQLGQAQTLIQKLQAQIGNKP